MIKKSIILLIFLGGVFLAYKVYENMKISNMQEYNKDYK